MNDYYYDEYGYLYEEQEPYSFTFHFLTNRRRWELYYEYY